MKKDLTFGNDTAKEKGHVRVALCPDDVTVVELSLEKLFMDS